MNNQEIRNHILKTFWDVWDQNKRIKLYLGVFSSQKYDQFEDTISEVREELVGEGFYDHNGDKLTGKGIIYVEELGLVDDERIVYHQNLRHKILSILFQIYENEGYSAEIYLTKLIELLNGETNDFSLSQIDNECEILRQIGLVKRLHPSISREGIEYWKDILLLKSFEDEFSDLANLKNITPQQRGRKLETLISKVLEFTGLNQEADVRTSYEQVDLIIHYQRELFLVECKWEKKPIEADVIDKLLEN